MDKNSDFGIWYLLIFFFVVMIFIPPIFRVLIPKESSDTVGTLKTLECKKTETLYGKLEDNSIYYEIKTLYSGDKISMINFKYSLMMSNQSDSTTIDKSQITNEIFNNIDELRNIKNAKVSEENNITNIKFNYLTYDFSNEVKLQKYSQNINNQKTMYEEQSFTCTIN